jgi:hypothetical protein
MATTPSFKAHQIEFIPVSDHGPGFEIQFEATEIAFAAKYIVRLLRRAPIGFHILRCNQARYRPLHIERGSGGDSLVGCQIRVGCSGQLQKVLQTGITDLINYDQGPTARSGKPPDKNQSPTG